MVAWSPLVWRAPHPTGCSDNRQLLSLTQKQWLLFPPPGLGPTLVPAHLGNHAHSCPPSLRSKGGLSQHPGAVLLYFVHRTPAHRTRTAHPSWLLTPNLWWGKQCLLCCLALVGELTKAQETTNSCRARMVPGWASALYATSQARASWEGCGEVTPKGLLKYPHGPNVFPQTTSTSAQQSR